MGDHENAGLEGHLEEGEPWQHRPMQRLTGKR
jgi:hypothetical protein